MSFEMRFSGAGTVAAAITTVAYKAREAALEALREECEIELAEAKRRTPVDTGLLRSTGKVVGPTVTGNRIMANIRFDTSYALYVHEDLSVFHKVGQAKFLESVLLESARYFPERVRARMAKLLGTR